MNIHRLMPPAAGLVLLALAGAAPALAGDGPVAIVEDTSGNVAGVEAFDLLARGKKITLPADGSVIISYLSSCQRENIRGGQVTIGDTQSEVSSDGEVGRRRIPCNPAALNLTPEQANQSATLMFRDPPLEAGIKFLSPTQLPVVIAPDLTEITITDVKAKTKRTVKVVKGVADITAGHEPLARAGVYELHGGGRSLIFRVGKEATSDPLPLLQRAIRL